MSIRNSFYKFSLSVLFAFFLAGCATSSSNSGDSSAEASTPDEFYDETNDAYESFNRRIFGFNSFLDRWLLKPVAKG